MSLLNSHYLYNQNQIGKQINFYDFRIANLSIILPKLENPARTLSFQDHAPSTHEKGTNGRNLRKICKQCTSKGIRKDTTYYCEACPEKPSLCLNMFQRIS